MHKYLFLLSFLILGCKTDDGEANIPTEIAESETIILDINQANRLAVLPLKCMQTEFPNKLGQTLTDAGEMGTPKELHPAFYGCFDWHSAVHGHWMLVKLLKTFPDLDNTDEIRQKLSENISEENILKELEYFQRKSSRSYERTYGWAWLLKLAEELHIWDDPLAKELEQNLQPLTDFIANKYLDFLPKLAYPIRVGEHTNTAFGLTFAWDYAATVGHDSLQTLIEQRSRDFYLLDKACPLSWEPSGFDFLSPCLEEADMMRRVLEPAKFKSWFDQFLPALKSSDFTLEVGKVSDRSDGKLVHLDGVNFSRAWCLYGISEAIPEYTHLNRIANEHIKAGLLNIIDGDYMGEHWLASFAIYALASAKKE